MVEVATAYAEPDTAVDGPDTAQLEEAEDTALETPDTADNAEPDTDTETTEAFTPEQVNARLTEERAKWESDLRTNIEEQQREQSARQRRTQAQQLREGQLGQQLQSVVKWAYEQAEQGKDFRFDPRSVNQIAANIEAAVFQDQSDAWGGAYDAYIGQNFKDFKPSAQTAARIASAFRDWRPDVAVAAQFDAMREAVAADMRPELEKTVRAEMEAAAKTAALKQNDTTRAGAPKPTGVGTSGGSGRPNFKTQQQVDMALYKGSIDSKTAREWTARGLPYQ